MKAAKPLTVITMLLLATSLSLQALAQPSGRTQPEVRAVRLLELYPSLLKFAPPGNLTSGWFLSNASPKLDKCAYYDRRKGVLYFIDRDGRQIQAFDLRSLGLHGPGHNAWSPDGTMLLSSIFNERKGHAAPLYLLKVDGTIEEVVPAQGVREQILQPCWSYDGRMFAYLKSIRTGHEIWVKNIESGEEILVERVPIGEGACGNPVWFNRHHKILYLKDMPDRRMPTHAQLWIFDIETRQRLMIYDGRVESIYPIISPDDSLIGTDTGRYFSLFDTNGNLIKNLELGSNTDPSWSPDGLNIAYLKGIVDPVTEILIEQHIHVININTGIDKDLTPVPGLKIDEFRWFDERTIVY